MFLSVSNYSYNIVIAINEKMMEGSKNSKRTYLHKGSLQKKKEYKLGNCPKRWEGVNLKTLFFIVENKEIHVRREGVRAIFPYFCPNFKWCP